MDLRQALFEMAAEHRLDAAGLRRLEQLAGLESEPDGLASALPRSVAVLAAALGGLGIVFWIAANWQTLGRFGRFALLEGFVVAMCAGALWRPRARGPLGLLAVLAIGGLFAYFGQTYQTGADPWQLFAVWAALALPFCIAARSDVLWAPWALITMTGISLWVRAHTGHSWRIQSDDLSAHLSGWLGALVLVAILSTPCRRYTGAGLWALRTALALAAVMITTTAIGALVGGQALLHYGLGLLVLAGAAVMLARAEAFDVFGLSAVALGLDSLLIGGLAYALFHNLHNDGWFLALLLTGLAAAGLVAATVSALLHLSRHRAAPP
jgi:uncharacterized membrane protein